MGPRISSTLPIEVCPQSELGILGAVQFSDLVLEIYWSVEIRYLSVDRFTNDFSFGSMQEASHF